MPGPFFSTVLLAGSMIDKAGNDEQKQKFLAPICRGEAKATVAVLEGDASWSPDAVKMQATATSAGYVLNGQKLFVTDAAVADFMVVVARLDGELALLVVPQATKGLTVEAMPAMDGTRKLYAVSFDGVSIPRENLLAQGKPARAALDTAYDIAAVGLAAEMTGGMQRLLDFTVEYAKTRKQFGRPIGQFQAVQHQCSDMLLYTESSRSAVYYAAWAMHEGIADASLAVSVAKAYASDAYRETGNRAIQIHGGMGFTWENDAHLYYRRAKASELTLGDAAYHRERIAKLVVDTVHAAVETEAAAVTAHQ
jgi:alkylation response protein AidB-like acyl-CoA dehydrogenase